MITPPLEAKRKCEQTVKMHAWIYKSHILTLGAIILKKRKKNKNWEAKNKEEKNERKEKEKEIMI
jgi:hypothetical protein